MDGGQSGGRRPRSGGPRSDSKARGPGPRSTSGRRASARPARGAGPGAGVGGTHRRGSPSASGSRNRRAGSRADRRLRCLSDPAAPSRSVPRSSHVRWQPASEVWPRPICSPTRPNVSGQAGSSSNRIRRPRPRAKWSPLPPPQVLHQLCPSSPEPPRSSGSARAEWPARGCSTR